MKRFTLSLLACSLGMLTHFRGNNLFDLLTYKIERLDDYDNYHLPTCVPKLQTGSDHDSEYGDIHRKCGIPRQPDDLVTLTG